MNFFEGGGRKIKVCPRAPDTLATPLNPPPQKKKINSDFFLKSEGKEIERKRKKMRGDEGGGRVNC